jgi:hypothetical protein
MVRSFLTSYQLPKKDSSPWSEWVSEWVTQSVRCTIKKLDLLRGYLHLTNYTKLGTWQKHKSNLSLLLTLNVHKFTTKSGNYLIYQDYQYEKQRSPVSLMGNTNSMGWVLLQKLIAAQLVMLLYITQRFIIGARVALLVQWLSYGLDPWVSIPSRGWYVFSSLLGPDWLCSPPGLPSNGKQGMFPQV